MKDDVTRMPISKVLRLCLIAALLAAAGCSGSLTGASSPGGDKTKDPALKAYMAKTAEAFKTKMQEMKTKSPKKVSSGGFRHP